MFVTSMKINCGYRIVDTLIYKMAKSANDLHPNLAFQETRETLIKILQERHSNRSFRPPQKYRSFRHAVEFSNCCCCCCCCCSCCCFFCCCCCSLLLAAPAAPAACRLLLLLPAAAAAAGDGMLPNAAAAAGCWLLAAGC